MAVAHKTDLLNTCFNVEDCYLQLTNDFNKTIALVKTETDASVVWALP